MKSIKYLAAFAMLSKECFGEQLFDSKQTIKFNQVSEGQALSYQEESALTVNHPKVQFKHMGQYDLSDAVDDTFIDHMTQGDIDSYYLYKGFIEESIKLSENRTELEKDEELNVAPLESLFKGVQNLISRPVHRVMMI